MPYAYIKTVSYTHLDVYKRQVNNKQPEGLRVLGNTPADAIGINKKVADRLSGADFDGDTVMAVSYTHLQGEKKEQIK